VAQVTHQEDEISYDADGLATPTGEKMYTASPATLATAIKFLKDNAITCDIKKDTNMTALKDALKKKNKRSLMTSAEAAASMEH
jgi:hypothetical protein